MARDRRNGTRSAVDMTNGNKVNPPRQRANGGVP
jgi:hypothetical protein